MRALEQKQADWRSGKHQQGWISSLEQYDLPRIGKRAVSEGTTGDVLDY